MNFRPLEPHSSALPICATPSQLLYYTITKRFCKVASRLLRHNFNIYTHTIIYINMNKILAKLQSIYPLITNTPMVRIQYKYHGTICNAYAKCEWYSLTGSIKDKPAYNIIYSAYVSGALHEGQPIVEATSGNMGISLSAIAAIAGNPITIVMPRSVSNERKQLLAMYSANVVLCDTLTQCVDMCKQLSTQGYFWCNQFANTHNVQAHYNATANEIINQLHSIKLNAFVAGVGTGGTLMGVGTKLKQQLGIKVIAVEPNSARVISGNSPAKHGIQGLNGDFVPAIFDRSIVSSVISVTDQDALAMSQKICQQLGLGVGISSGANLLGAILSGSNAVTVFPDDNKKYLSTPLTTPIHTALVDSIELLCVECI